jgi:DNA-binding Xre family transcriptional regulator
MQIAGATLDMKPSTIKPRDIRVDTPSKALQLATVFAGEPKPLSIRQRAARIRLPLKELAQLAGVSEDNLHRVIRGNVDPRVSTMQKIEDALVAEEQRLLRELGVAGDAA